MSLRSISVNVKHQQKGKPASVAGESTMPSWVRAPQSSCRMLVLGFAPTSLDSWKPCLNANSSSSSSHKHEAMSPLSHSQRTAQVQTYSSSSFYILFYPPQLRPSNLLEPPNILVLEKMQQQSITATIMIENPKYFLTKHMACALKQNFYLSGKFLHALDAGRKT